MLLNRKQKEEIVSDIEDKLSRVKSVVLVDYKGMKVKDMQALRKQLLVKKIDFKVMKNNLLRIVLEKNKLEIDKDILDKPLAAAFSFEDEVDPCKIVYEFSRECEQTKILGGILDKAFISKDEIKALAAIPSRTELHAKVVGGCAAPITGLVYVLSANIKGLLHILKTKSEQK